jgi:hypothetical protein
VHAEVDPRHPEVGHAGEHLAARRHDVLFVVGRGQRAGPRVEQLDGRRACFHLRPQAGDGEVGQAVEQVGPQGRVAVHQRLRPPVRARRLALDEVARNRERRAREADQRDRELAHELAHGLGHVWRVGVGFERAEAVEVGLVAERCGDDGTDARADLDAEADGGDGYDDVRVEDRGVDAVPPDRLQRQFGREIRLCDRVEDAAGPALRAVLGERPARLPHEPHRDARVLFAAAGGEEG